MVNKSKFTAYEDIFSNGSKSDADIVKLPLSKLHEFPDHPFSVIVMDDMDKLVASIKQLGVQQPITVRLREDGEYDIVAGHRRVKASQLAGIYEIDAVVKEMSDYEAISWMVDSNLMTRENIRHSERAKALNMEFKAFKKERSNLISQGRADEAFASEKKMSRNQVVRYLKLNDLIPKFLYMVDDGRLPFNVGVELAYLSVIEQNNVFKFADEKGIKINLNMATMLKRYHALGQITADEIMECLIDQAKKPKKNLLVDPKKIKEYIPKSVSEEHYDEYVVKALQYYAKYQEKKKEAYVET